VSKRDHHRARRCARPLSRKPARSQGEQLTPPARGIPSTSARPAPSGRFLLFEMIQILGKPVADFFAPPPLGHAFSYPGYHSGAAIAQWNHRDDLAGDYKGFVATVGQDDSLDFVVEFLFASELGLDFNLADIERLLTFASNESARVFTPVAVNRHGS